MFDQDEADLLEAAALARGASLPSLANLDVQSKAVTILEAWGGTVRSGFDYNSRVALALEDIAGFVAGGTVNDKIRQYLGAIADGGYLWDNPVETVEVDLSAAANLDVQALGDGVVDAAGITGLLRNIGIASATSSDVVNGTGLVNVGFATGASRQYFRATNVLTEWDPELDAIEFTMEYSSLSLGTRYWWQLQAGDGVISEPYCGYYQEGGGPAGVHMQNNRVSTLNTPGFSTGAIRIRQESPYAAGFRVWRGTSVSTLAVVGHCAGLRGTMTNGPWELPGTTYKPEFSITYPIIGTVGSTLTKATVRRARY